MNLHSQSRHPTLLVALNYAPARKLGISHQFLNDEDQSKSDSVIVDTKNGKYSFYLILRNKYLKK